MKLLIIFLVLAAVVFVECKHTFMGTNFLRHRLYYKQLKYSSYESRNRIGHFNYTMPNHSKYRGRSIQGILAYDLTYSAATANITAGGLGYRYLTLRMKSERGKKMIYNIYIYG